MVMMSGRKRGSMRIVIDIPKTAYEYFAQGFRFTDDVEMAIIAIVNGTPLPKGHGRLIDADKLNRKNVNCANVPMNFIDTAKTIIDADKAEGEDKA